MNSIIYLGIDVHTTNFTFCALSVTLGEAPKVIVENQTVADGICALEMVDYLKKQAYFEREVLPFAPDAWIDEKKSKVGYEIPFTRYFYKCEAPRPSEEIMAEIMELEKELSGSLEEVFR